MNDAQPSTPNSHSLPTQAGKVEMAMLLRREQQYQAADQVVLDHNRRWRENQQRVMEARMQKHGAQGAGPQQGDDMGDISIDSPVTVNHNYPAPPPAERPTADGPAPITPAVPAGGSFLRKALPFVLAAATGLGGLYAGAKLLAPAAPPSINTTTGLGFKIELPQAAPK